MQLKDIKANPKNPRTITNEKKLMLKKSLEEFGDLSGIVYNRKSKQIVGGTQRKIVLPEDTPIKIEHSYDPPTKSGTIVEGYALVDGERFAYREVSWDLNKEKAANIAANKGAGEWDFTQLGEWMRELESEDFDLDLTMFDEDERSKFFDSEGTEGLCDEDELPDKVEPKTKPGDIYLLGDHKLLCGDATDINSVESLIGKSTIELCFTSPPYADQREYNGGKELSPEHLATFIRASSNRVNYFAINLGYSRKNGEVNPYWEDYIKEAKSSGLKFLSWNIWDKGECGSIGNQTAMFAIQHEWIFVFGINKKDLNLTIENKKVNKLRCGSIRNADGTLTPVSNTKLKVRQFSQLKTILTQTPQKARKHGIDHPAMFPVEFPEHYINAMTSIGDVIYEPFAGSGSTLIACEKTKRKCYMMELDPKYCDVIVARYEKFTGKSAIIAGQ